MAGTKKKFSLENCVTPRIKDAPVLDPSLLLGFKCELGCVATAQGSAFVSIGATKVICSTMGPRANQRTAALFTDHGVLDCEVRYAPFSTTDTDAIGTNNRISASEKLLAEEVKNAVEASIRLELYPKSFILINIMILEAYNGNELSAAIIAASMALADAAIELRDLVSACTLVFEASPSSASTSTSTNSSSSSIRNSSSSSSSSVGSSNSPAGQPPAVVDEVGALSVLTVSSMNRLSQTTSICFDGRVSAASLSRMIQSGEEGCKAARVAMDSVLRNKLSQ